MTDNQVIEWAREAGLYAPPIVLPDLQRLARLAYEQGRNDENEACAKMCEAYKAHGLDCADDIRARMKGEGS